MYRMLIFRHHPLIWFLSKITNGNQFCTRILFLVGTTGYPLSEEEQPSSYTVPFFRFGYHFVWGYSIWGIPFYIAFANFVCGFVCLGLAVMSQLARNGIQQFENGFELESENWDQV